MEEQQRRNVYWQELMAMQQQFEENQQQQLEENQQADLAGNHSSEFLSDWSITLILFGVFTHSFQRRIYMTDKERVLLDSSSTDHFKFPECVALLCATNALMMKHVFIP